MSAKLFIRKLLTLKVNPSYFGRNASSVTRCSEGSRKLLWKKYAAAVAIAYAGWMVCERNGSTVHAFKTKKKEKEEEFGKGVKLTSRERHFINFASAEYAGQIYMTPQDFLESFVEREPRPRLKRRVVTEAEINSMKDWTPPLKKGSTQLFRSMREKEPQTGFKIAFNMFDTDGNQKVDKNEFLVILKLLSCDLENRSANNDEMRIAMEKIFSAAWAEKRTEAAAGDGEGYSSDGDGLQRKNAADTTLLLHFFGKKGGNALKYDDFKRFMENLQTEVLEMEFQEFAKGAEVISELDFAQILLRYTRFDAKICNEYIERLLTRLKEVDAVTPGITFQEFKTFCQFLNNLEDFVIAMRMYTLADHPISKEEFHRAVKICTGTNLSKHLVHTVFDIFDEDDDGQLSYMEFIAIMRDRLHRGFKSHTKGEGWEAFKTCVKQEMNSPVSR